MVKHQEIQRMNAILTLPAGPHIMSAITPTSFIIITTESTLIAGKQFICQYNSNV